MSELEQKLEPVVPKWELHLWNQSQAESSVLDCVLKDYKDLDSSVLASPRGELSSTRVGWAKLIIQISQVTLEPAET